MTSLRIMVLSVGVAVGVFLPFVAVILAGLGFSPSAIGLVLDATGLNDQRRPNGSWSRAAWSHRVSRKTRRSSSPKMWREPIG